MTIASDLAAFVTRQSYEDLPPKAIEYAQMLISSTVASAALGSTIESAKIVRAVEVERGGKPEATVWFGAAEKLPVGAPAAKTSWPQSFWDTKWCLASLARCTTASRRRASTAA
jgi:2-methylcitrate dehydratase PrpD